MYILTLLRACREWSSMLFLLGLALFGVARLPQLESFGRGLRGRVRQHPWLVFPLVSLFLMATSYLGYMKEGGRDNSFSPHTYFLTISGCFLLLGSQAFPSAERVDNARFLSVIRPRLAVFSISAIGIMLCAYCVLPVTSCEALRLSLMTLALGVGAALALLQLGHIESFRAFADKGTFVIGLVMFLQMAFHMTPFTLNQFLPHPSMYKGPVIGAFDFARKHPNQVYFPYDPLSTLLVDKKLYHFDYGLFDRRLGGYEVSEEHFRKHLPSDLKYVVYPRWVAEKDTPRESLRYLKEFSGPMHFRGLEDWDIYIRPDDASSIPEAKSVR
jgi:hypothetical protein